MDEFKFEASEDGKKYNLYKMIELTHNYPYKYINRGSRYVEKGCVTIFNRLEIQED